MIVHTCDQRSPEWMSVRLGKLTSTGAADMLATIQKGEAASRRNLRLRLVLERVTGKSGEREFRSAAMDDGIIREADAYAAYEALTGTLLQRTGFVQHDELMAGCSLDGSTDDFSHLIEIKCPEPSAHLDALRSGQVPGHYLKQVIHALFITGAKSCDWMSYNPDFPDSLQVKLIRVTRDEAVMADYESKARIFLAEVDREVEAIRTLTDLRGQLERATA